MLIVFSVIPPNFFGEICSNENNCVHEKLRQQVYYLIKTKCFRHRF